MRKFLFERIPEGYCFPLNPAWPLRDPGWYDILQALRNNPACRDCMTSWYPPTSGLLDDIDRIHRKYPGGFKTMKGRSSSKKCAIADHAEDMSALEGADLALHE